MRKLVSLVVIAIMGLTVFGCGAAPGKNAEKKLPEQKTQSETAKSQPADEATKPADKTADNKTTDNKTTDNKTTEDKTTDNKTTEDKTADNEQVQPKKELNKKIEVLVEGEKEMREANLNKSDYLGFELYVLKGFSLESEEPGKDIIISEFDGDFFARIEKLNGNVNLDEYKNQLKAAFEQTGKVTEMDPATLSHEKFRDSKFCLLTEMGYSDNNSPKTSIIYLVKDFGGQLFAITFHMPLKEAAEGITPSLWAMVSTLEVQ